MHLFLTALVVFHFFHSSNAACKCLCAACGAPPTFTDPPPSPGTTRGTGTITETIGASGCKQYTVTCDANGYNYVSIGANGAQLSPSSAGAKTAVLLCNDNKQIEACGMDDNSLVTTTVYCSNTIPPCSTCGSLSMADPPPSPGTTRGTGTITETINASGCKQYTVTCDANGYNYVSVGSNGAQLSPSSAGQKTAVLLCNDNKQIEAMDGNSLATTTVYCSNTIPPCSTCGSLPKTGPPASSTGTASGPGTVTPSQDANGCITYRVDCEAVGTNFVVVGANQQFIQLSAAGPGAKSATLFCDNNGQIEGVDPAGNVVITTSVYCSYAT